MSKELEALILQTQKNGKEISSSLDALLTHAVKKEAQKIEMPKIDGNEYLSKVLSAFFEAIKGDKGDAVKGDTPQKGKDYFTEKEKKEMVQEVKSLIPPPIDGKTPEKGIDYFTEEEISDLVSQVKSLIRTPLDGETPTREELINLIKPFIPKDGKSPTKDEITALIKPLIPKELDAQNILAKLRSLKKEKGGLSYDDLRDLPNLQSLASKSIEVKDANGVLIEGNLESLNITGAGATVTTDKHGNITINVPAVGSGYQAPTGTVDGVNTVFVFTTAPNSIVVDGQSMRKTASDGTVNWTVVGSTITLIIAPNFDIYSTS